jgi:hypothetical protein
MTLFALADGCNWGERPRQASNRAKDAFVAYLMQKTNEFKTPRDIAPHLVNALACSHISIIHDKEEVRLGVFFFFFFFFGGAQFFPS